MFRTVPRLVGAAVLVAALATGTACGSSSDKAACSAIKKDIQDVATSGSKQISDPQGLAKTYRDGGNKIRSDAQDAGADVKSAAGEVASAMDGLATALSQLSTSTTALPDTRGLISASTRLQKACLTV